MSLSTATCRAMALLNDLVMKNLPTWLSKAGFARSLGYERERGMPYWIRQGNDCSVSACSRIEKALGLKPGEFYRQLVSAQREGTPSGESKGRPLIDVL